MFHVGNMCFSNSEKKRCILFFYIFCPFRLQLKGALAYLSFFFYLPQVLNPRHCF